MSKYIVAAVFVLSLSLLPSLVFAEDKCKALEVNKTRVTDKDVLTIRLKRCAGERYKYLGIDSPTPSMYYYVSDDFAQKEDLVVFTQEQFEYIETLRLPIATFKARPYLVGAQSPRKVFDEKGDYEIIFGNDLHTDVERGDLERMIIHYEPGKP
jgi:hypothetical protein